MSATMSGRYARPRHQQEVDGGYSGRLTVTVADRKPGVPQAIFVDSDCLHSRYMLSPDEAAGLIAALTTAVEVARR